MHRRKNYLDTLKKEFKNKVFSMNSFRSNKNDAFKIYPRNNHRYKLGKEILYETILLSSCDVFIYVQSNVSEFVKIFNVNKKQKDLSLITDLIQK